ncbi:MAG: hypothetical protein QM664_14240, partial [Flavihumibacter sp.]
MATAIDFEDIYSALKQKVEELAKAFLQRYTKAAIKDGKNFLEETKENLKRWTTLLMEERLTSADLEWLLLS